MSDEAVRGARQDWEIAALKAENAAIRADFAQALAEVRQRLEDAKLPALAAEVADLARQARGDRPEFEAMVDFLAEDRRTRADRETSEQLKQHSLSFLVKAVKELQRRQRSNDHRARVLRTRTRVVFRSLSGLSSAVAMAAMVGELTGTGGALLTIPSGLVFTVIAALLTAAILFLWASVDVPEPEGDEDDLVVETAPPKPP